MQDKQVQYRWVEVWGFFDPLQFKGENCSVSRFFSSASARREQCPSEGLLGPVRPVSTWLGAFSLLFTLVAVAGELQYISQEGPYQQVDIRYDTE